MSHFNKKTDGIICISKRLSDRYKYQKMLYIPPLMDYENYDDQKLNDGKKHFVYSGNAATGKDDLVYLIKVLSSVWSFHKNIKFHIIGVNRTELKNNRKVLSIEEEKFMTEAVLFYGRLDNYESRKIIKKLDFSIFFRNQTRANNFGFPTKFAESFSCGVPVVTNDFSDIKEYLKDGYNGFLIENLKKEEVVAKIIDILLIPEDEHRLIRHRLITQKDFCYRKYSKVITSFLINI